MSKLTKRYGFYEYFYLFVMVIFMAQMTGGTRYYTFSISRPFPSLIPLSLTIILLLRNKITFNNRWLKVILLFFFCWFVAYTIKIKRYGGVYMPLWVSYLSVVIIYSYIHAAVFGKDLFLLFEQIMVGFAIISLVLYCFQLFLPNIAKSFFSLFPDTNEGGYNFLYLYKYFYEMPERDFYSGIVRNSGCSWEPGRFSIMLVYAVCVNIFKNGKVSLNRNLIILNIALLSTFSTTGIVILFFEYFLFTLSKISLPRLLLVLAIFVPAGFFIYNLDFVSSKFSDQINIFKNLDTFTQHLSYRGEDDPIIALERIPSIGFEFKNWLEEPILGYGYWPNSWFANNVTEFATTCGGLMQVFSVYGLILGAFFYYCLFRSSQNISKMFGNDRGYIIFVITLMSSVAYPVFGVMFFTTIWFYGLFIIDKNKK